MRNAHRLRHLDKRAIVQVQLVALVQLVAVLVVGVAEKVAGLIVDHDAVVEGVKLEEAILPALLLAADIVGEETAELSNGRGALGGLDGSNGGGVLGVAQRGRHGTGSLGGRVVGRCLAYDMDAGAGLVGRVKEAAARHACSFRAIT